LVEFWNLKVICTVPTLVPTDDEASLITLGTPGKKVLAALHTLVALARTRVFSAVLALVLCHPVQVMDSGEAGLLRKLFTRFDCLEFIAVAVVENPETLRVTEFAEITGEAGRASMRTIIAAVILSRILPQ
jgi:hypothetical protein